ncbi:MAG: NVEALA domain-containing protein [Tannerellaceae bacterium]|jgi:hypothetical protein|nr:NVEALA domain-containing protein [Tannerellaceae bacterium]
MRKKIMSIAFVAAIAVAAAWNFSWSSKAEVELSDLALANVEALAGCETLIDTCWISPDYSKCCDGGVYGCSPCD